MTDRFTCAKCGFRCSVADLQDRGGGALHCPNCVAPTGVKRLEACPVPDDRTPEKDAAMLRVAGDAPSGMDAYCERNAAEALAAQGVTLLPSGDLVCSTCNELAVVCVECGTASCPDHREDAAACPVCGDRHGPTMLRIAGQVKTIASPSPLTLAVAELAWDNLKHGGDDFFGGD